MTSTVELPLWFFLLIVLFAAVTFASHFLFPSVRWFLRRRAERVVAELNKRLERPIQPFKLLRRPDMIQRLIYDPKVMEAVSDYAHDNAVREDVAFEKARAYAREIVPGFSASAYFGFGTRAAKWLSRSLYDVRVADGDRVMEVIDPQATVVFVMNHRSNMDYVLVTYAAAKSSALAYAVGEWARVWPLRTLIRALGGYFIRRGARTALYRRVLSRYVQMATGAGVAQALFPEGGLSLDGHLAPPKVGLLSYLMAEFDETGRDLVFVPVALNYDRVLEDTILLAAGQGGTRRFRGSAPEAIAFSLRYVMRRMTGRGYKMGMAGVAFGPPLSLRSFPDATPESVAAELMDRIGRTMPVLPVPLVAAILLEKGDVERSVLEAEFSARVSALPEPVSAPFVKEVGVFDAAMKILARRAIVAETGGVVRLAPDRKGIMAYYAASLSAHVDATAERPEPQKTDPPESAAT